VEFALVAPLALVVLLGSIDIGRLIYTYNAISSAARDGARLVALRSQLSSDCLPLQRMEQVGQGFSLAPDPNSIANQSVNTDPNNPGSGGPTTPPPGTGYIYIWPAAATAAPQDGINSSGVKNCRSATQRAGTGAEMKQVAVEIEYAFRPLTPLINAVLPQGGIIIRTISVVQTEY
jgi:Flp pilus assembly protein TadG